MSNARFWFVPLKDIAPAEQRDQLAARDDVRASDLPPSYTVSSKLFDEGIRAGHVLALHNGDSVVALARVLRLDGAGTLHWRRLPMLEAPELSATPELREITAAEAQQFKIGIDAILRDVPAAVGTTAAPTLPAETDTPSGPTSNIILYGPPGTGKTYCLKARALGLALGSGVATTDLGMATQWLTLQSEGRVAICTFHQAYTYEEFVEGLRAETTDDHQVRYRVRAGLFKVMACRAILAGLKLPPGDLPSSEEAVVSRAMHALKTGEPLDFSAAKPFVLVVDEINRANVARVLGELITLLEPDKRLTRDDELRLHLPASGDLFGVPPNLHIIGTMNTADRSIALMDVALRRRFSFEEMRPSAEVIRHVLGAKKGAEKVPPAIIELTVKLFERINERLRYLYDRDHQIGHAYFLKVQSLGDLRDTMALRVLPLLQEYFFGQWEKVAMVLGYPVNSEGIPKKYRPADEEVPTILVARKLVEKEVLGFDHAEYIDQVAWEVHPAFQADPKYDFGDDRDMWLAKALFEVVAGTERDAAAKGLVDKLNGAGA